jgi:zinc/manganese transport system ATP-binding protein
MTAIVGANGCGKSTLLKTLAGILPPVSGTLRWSPSRPVIGWLAQRQTLDPHFRLRCRMWSAWVPGRVSRCFAVSIARPERMLRSAGASRAVTMAQTTVEALSGGQFQRMLFARMWLQQAPLVMLDEPFTGIDEATSQVLMEQIVDMHQQGQTILAVLHDSERVKRYFPRRCVWIRKRPLGSDRIDLNAEQRSVPGMIWHLFFQPFIEFGFMRRALVVCLALSVSTTALGVFLQLRRMSLMGDALSHAILPGVAAGYLLNGMSLLAMSLGGFCRNYRGAGGRDYQPTHAAERGCQLCRFVSRVTGAGRDAGVAARLKR